MRRGVPASTPAVAGLVTVLIAGKYPPCRSFSEVRCVSLDPQPREQWRAELLRAGTIRPHRAVRLDNGNTLITDQQKGQVVEIDSKSVEVWKVTGLSHPAQAVRLEDGNTLILEQSANRVIEIDPSNPRNRTEILKRGLSVPMGMTVH